MKSPLLVKIPHQGISFGKLSRFKCQLKVRSRWQCWFTWHEWNTYHFTSFYTF